MKEKDCYLLGKIIKTHGLNGQLKVRLDVDSPENYSKLTSIFLKIKEKLVPFFLKILKYDLMAYMSNLKK